MGSFPELKFIWCKIKRKAYGEITRKIDGRSFLSLDPVLKQRCILYGRTLFTYRDNLAGRFLHNMVFFSADEFKTTVDSRVENPPQKLTGAWNRITENVSTARWVKYLKSFVGILQSATFATCFGLYRPIHYIATQKIKRQIMGALP